MIKSRNDLRDYIHADLLALKKKPSNWLIDSVKRALFWEKILVKDYLLALRRFEYFTNIKKNPFQKIAYAVALYRYRRISFKTHINIPANVAGPGLTIYHLGPITINSGARLGHNCTLFPEVIIGQKNIAENVPVVGDNVYFSAGSKAFGKIRIGNNVIVAPNSVVIHDVPDNCVVSGVPAKIIKRDGLKVSE